MGPTVAMGSAPGERTTPGGKPAGGFPSMGDHIKPPMRSSTGTPPPRAPAPFGEWTPDQGVRPQPSTSQAIVVANPLSQPNRTAQVGMGAFRFNCDVPRLVHALADSRGFPAYRGADWGGDVLVLCTRDEAQSIATDIGGQMAFTRIGDNLGGLEHGGQPVPTEVQVRSECEAVGRTPPSKPIIRHGWER